MQTIYFQLNDFSSAIIREYFAYISMHLDKLMPNKPEKCKDDIIKKYSWARLTEQKRGKYFILDIFWNNEKLAFILENKKNILTVKRENETITTLFVVSNILNEVTQKLAGYWQDFSSK